MRTRATSSMPSRLGGALLREQEERCDDDDGMQGHVAASCSDAVMMMRRICSARCRSSGRTWHAAAGDAATWSWHSLRCLCTCVCVGAGVFSFDKTSSGVGEDSRVLLGPALLRGSLSLLRGSAADGVNWLRLRLPPTPLAPSVQPGLGSVGWSRRGEDGVASIGLVAMCAGGGVAAGGS